MILSGPVTRLFCTGIICFSCFFPSSAWATVQSELQTVQIFFENDLFGNTDKYYTNAVQITWLSNDLKRYRDDVRLPKWTIPVIHAIPFSGDTKSIHNVGILLGQQIFTPSDIQETKLLDNDRPYAGFLYGGLALHSKIDTKLDTLEIVFGVVGPSAKAELAQNTVHRMRNISTAKGWDNQLHNEPGVSFSWQRKWRLHSRQFFDFLSYDWMCHSGITLGNVRTSGYAGSEIRFGYHIPNDFGSDVIHAGAGVSAPVIKRSKSNGRPFGAHIFVSSQLEAVMHDIFLDGNTWKHSHSVDKKPLVADLSVGFSLNFNLFKMTYRHLFRTRQFYKQKKGQTIGSLTMTIAF